MEPITKFTSKVIPLHAENVDTDQIIPARFLKTTSKAGLGDSLFCDWRYDADGQSEAGLRAEPVGDEGASSTARRRQLRLRQFARARAVGAHRVRAPGNHQHVFRRHLPEQRVKNGLLPVVVDAETHRRLFEQLAADPHASLTVDLHAQTLTLPDGTVVHFPIDAFSRTCLLQGVDELGYLLGHEAKIAAYEAVLEHV